MESSTKATRFVNRDQRRQYVAEAIDKFIQEFIEAREDLIDIIHKTDIEPIPSADFDQLQEITNITMFQKQCRNPSGDDRDDLKLITARFKLEVMRQGPEDKYKEDGEPV